MTLTINESYTAKGWTPEHLCPAVFAGYARTIESITIHHWGLPGQTHQGVVDFFCTTGPGETSAHFVASAGRVDCIVSPMDVAWHAGNTRGNATSVGIECRPEASEADYQTVAELVAWLRATYGKDLPLIPHRDWQATACPGIWNLAKLDRMARAITAGTSTVISQPTPTTPSKETTMANLTNENLRSIAGTTLNTNIQEFKADGTKWGVKPFAKIVGNLNQWFTRVFDQMDRIEVKLDQILTNQKAVK